MIKFKTGNLLAEDAEALVNTVNCVGVMGRGIALQFKRAFPDNFAAYAKACKKHEVKPGEMFVYELGQISNPKYIINFPTKRHWRGKSRMEDIDSGLIALVNIIRSRCIKSIAIPPLGSGLGGLDWSQVRSRIQHALSDIDDLEIIVFEPGGGPADSRANRSSKVPNMTPGRAALVGLIDRYMHGLLDPSISLLELHKLMYFMQESGEKLQLKYAKGQYGPYADNLRHVLHAIEGHFVSGYKDGGDDPKKPLELVPGVLDDAKEFIADRPDTKKHLEQVADLVEGFESSFGLELLATVHWLVDREKATNLDQVVKQTYLWNQKKKKFSIRQIEIALETLTRKNWLEPVVDC